MTVAVGAAPRALLVVLVVLVACTPAPPPSDDGLATGALASAVPTSAPLPLDALVFDGDATGSFELYTAGADGGDVRQLTDDARWDSWWPRLSPDRRSILFYRSPAGTHDRHPTRNALWVVAADGTGAAPLRPVGADGWEAQGHAEWSPDGQRLVMAGGDRSNLQIWTTDALGRDPVALTQRGGTNIDPSWSADGERVYFVGCPRAVCFEHAYEIYVVDAAGGDPTRLTADEMADYDPYESPDGRRLAWLTKIGPGDVWDVRVAGTDAARPRRLVGDDGVTSKPEWSPDGTEIVAHRRPLGATRFSIWRVGADGTGLREILAGDANVEYPSW